MYPYKRDKYKQLRVFKLKFDRDEFDMMIHDPEKLAYAERNYGPILSRTVLCRGPDHDPTSDVSYRNVCSYLNSLASEFSGKRTCVKVTHKVEADFGII